MLEEQGMATRCAAQPSLSAIGTQAAPVRGACQQASAHLKTPKGFWSEADVGAQRRRMKGFPARLRFSAQ